MNDKEYNEIKRRITRIAERWRREIGLGWFKIKYEWDRENFCDVGGDPNGTNGYFCSAHVSVKWEYRYATLTFHLPQLLNESDDELEKVILHEFSHILVNQMRPEIAPHDEVMAMWRKNEELCVTMVADALRWARDEGIKDGRKQERADKTKGRARRR